MSPVATLSTLPPLLLASVGERLAAAALQLQQQEAQLSAGARSRLAELEQLGLQLQALVHALGGPGAGPAEQVPLLEAAQAARRLWLSELQRRGQRLTVDGEALSLELDPARLQHALDLLIAHGLAAGGDLRLTVQASPQPALLIGGAGAGPDPAELHGQLLQWLARAHLWPLLRPAAPKGEWRLALLLGGDSAEEPATPALWRHWSEQDRVLLIEPDDRVRVQAAALLHGAGLRADCVNSLDQAAQALVDGDPSVLVTGIPVDDPSAQSLFLGLRQRLPRLRWVELVDQPHLFSAGSADGRVPARISRSDLAHTLLASLAS